MPFPKWVLTFAALTLVGCNISNVKYQEYRTVPNSRFLTLTVEQRVCEVERQLALYTDETRQLWLACPYRYKGSTVPLVAHIGPDKKKGPVEFTYNAAVAKVKSLKNETLLSCGKNRYCANLEAYGYVDFSIQVADEKARIRYTDLSQGLKDIDAFYEQLDGRPARGPLDPQLVKFINPSTVADRVERVGDLAQLRKMTVQLQALGLHDSGPVGPALERRRVALETAAFRQQGTFAGFQSAFDLTRDPSDLAAMQRLATSNDEKSIVFAALVDRYKSDSLASTLQEAEAFAVTPRDRTQLADLKAVVEESRQAEEAQRLAESRKAEQTEIAWLVEEEERATALVEEEERATAETLRKRASATVNLPDHVVIKSTQGCKLVNPNPVPNETVRWSGACKNGYAQGSGTLTWFKDGVKNGPEVSWYYENGLAIRPQLKDMSDYLIQSSDKKCGFVLPIEGVNRFLNAFSVEFNGPCPTATSTLISDGRGEGSVRIYYNGDLFAAYKGQFARRVIPVDGELILFSGTKFVFSDNVSFAAFITPTTIDKWLQNINVVRAPAKSNAPELQDAFNIKIGFNSKPVAPQEDSGKILVFPVTTISSDNTVKAKYSVSPVDAKKLKSKSYTISLKVEIKLVETTSSGIWGVSESRSIFKDIDIKLNKKNGYKSSGEVVVVNLSSYLSGLGVTRRLESIKPSVTIESIASKD